MKVLFEMGKKNVLNCRIIKVVGYLCQDSLRIFFSERQFFVDLDILRFKYYLEILFGICDYVWYNFKEMVYVVIFEVIGYKFLDLGIVGVYYGRIFVIDIYGF